MDTLDDTTDRPITDEHDAALPELESPAPHDGPRLRRSRTRRMVGGVAGGIAERFDVDVSLVRVAFVVLTVAWGLGAVIYAAMWALVPKEPAGEGDDDATPVDGDPQLSWWSILLLTGVLAFGLIAVTSWWGGPRLRGPATVLWLALAFGLLALVFGSTPRTWRLRRAFGVLAIAMLALVALVVGVFLALVASTGVPITGGVGDRVYVPAALAQVRPEYRLAAGNLTVDLRRVHFAGTAPRHVTASVAVGVVTVEVPPGVVVDVNAHSGFGTVVASGGIASFGTAPSGSPKLVLTVDAGVGQVRLIRGTESLEE